MEETKAVAVKDTAAIDRFTNKVIACYGDEGNGITISEREKDIIKGYFNTIDLALKDSKDGYTWGQIELNKLAPRLMHYARLGLDMQLPNHLSPVPFRNRNTGKVTLNLIPGYEGRKYVAQKFALDPPKDIIEKLVCANDNFKAIYRDANHDHDDYIFESNPFNRGDIIGGFAYVIYDDSSKNKLITMSLDEIKKHEPRGGSSFWKGEWATKMYEKTLVIEACKSVPLDAEKVREYKADLDQVKSDELNNAAAESEAEAMEKMSRGEFVDVVETDFTEVPVQPEEKVEEKVQDSLDEDIIL